MVRLFVVFVRERFSVPLERRTDEMFRRSVAFTVIVITCVSFARLLSVKERPNR